MKLMPEVEYLIVKKKKKKKKDTKFTVSGKLELNGFLFYILQH